MPAVGRFNGTPASISERDAPQTVAKMPAVVKANPYLKPQIATVARVTRPARYLGTHYNEGSKIIYQGISQILNGRPASSVLPSIQSKLERLAR